MQSTPSTTSGHAFNTHLEQLRDPILRFRRQGTKTRLALIDPERILSAVDSEPALLGAGVVFVDRNYDAFVLREFKPLCRLEPVHVVIHEAPGDPTPTQLAHELRNSARPSKMVGNALGAGLACGGAALGWLAVFGASATIPLTGPAGATTTLLGAAAATASTVQCFNHTVRTGFELAAPEVNDWLDSETWYTTTSRTLDLVSLAGAGAATFTTVRMVKNLKATTHKSTREILHGLNRQERARLAQELAILQNPGASMRTIKQMRRTGQLPTRYTNQQIRFSVANQIKDAFSGALAVGGSVHSGLISALAIGVYESMSP